MNLFRYNADTSGLPTDALAPLANTLKGASVDNHALFSCIAELVANVYAHAPNSEISTVKWQICLDLVDSILTATVTDNGQGIPTSIRQRFSDPSISAERAIAAAVEGNYQQGRGQGLRSIREHARRSRIASMFIESHSCFYKVDESGDTINTSERFFAGTLIVLKISLKNTNQTHEDQTL